MTNPTPHGQVPEALNQLFEKLEDCIYEWSNYVRADDAPTTLPKYTAGAIKDLRVAVAELYHRALRNAHVQNPTKIEHVAGDASENGAELDTSQQPAPAEVVYSTPEEMFDAILTPQPAPATQQAGDLPESLVKWAYSPELVETGNHWQQGYEHARAWVHVQLSCSNIAPQPSPQAGAAQPSGLNVWLER